MSDVLKFLGCGSAYNTLWGNNSAYFEDKRTLFLIDCGETVFSKLFEKDMLKKYEEIYVLITHMHADHVGSLGSLISYSYNVLKKMITVVYPDDSLQKLLDLMGINRATYIFKKYRRAFIRRIKIESVPVKHADDMKCFGYVVKNDNYTLYYSGDSYEIPEIVLQSFLTGNIDEIFQDTTLTVTSHKSHLPLSELAAVIPKDIRHKVFCMHLSSDFSNEIEKLGFNNVIKYVET